LSLWVGAVVRRLRRDSARLVGRIAGDRTFL